MNFKKLYLLVRFSVIAAYSFLQIFGIILCKLKNSSNYSIKLTE